MAVTAVASVILALVCLLDLGAAIRTPVPISGGAFEASGVKEVDGGGVLFVDDGRRREVFYMELAPDGSQRGEVARVPLGGADVMDLEGITAAGGWFYVVGSQSKKSGFEGDGLVRFRFDPRSRRAGDVQRIQGVKRWLANTVPELKGTERRVGDKVLNIEAIAWDPRGERLLLGLRAPIVDGAALVIPVTLKDANAPLTLDNVAIDGSQIIHLPLDGAGIRSLEYHERSGAFRIITGAALNDENREFRLLEWNGLGGPESKVREIARFPRTLKPEGITGRAADGPGADVIVFDTSRFVLLD